MSDCEKRLDHMTKMFRAAWKYHREPITYEDWVFRNEYFAWMDARMEEVNREHAKRILKEWVF